MWNANLYSLAARKYMVGYCIQKISKSMIAWFFSEQASESDTVGITVRKFITSHWKSWCSLQKTWVETLPAFCKNDSFIQLARFFQIPKLPVSVFQPNLPSVQLSHWTFPQGKKKTSKHLKRHTWLPKYMQQNRKNGQEVVQCLIWHHSVAPATAFWKSRTSRE